ncbi:Ribosomal large subunit pseudouridine synthase D [Sedimentisphaera cyanobacteriorum]|uniref:Pseudouridine synthase n=1 Tax=Sedimentisphaera cyanobacteriorum TaxID=1940790 RepID=A0A1Q2HSY9_9BACT|nr:RluA family pseudouridine synthase [Sedimentisphaera cyanobacteriorum]AQQ10406.1 Ribosomal large subunit pseudouridine synthase D [Sedimentisphaera cyanobacteriorum]
MAQAESERQIPFIPGEELEMRVGGGKQDVRLDSYLCSRFGQLSRQKMQRVIRQQEILVNGVKAKPSRKLCSGDLIKLTLPSREIEPEAMELEVIYEDEDVVAVNKAPGAIVHPGRGNPNGTLLNGLYHYAAGRFSPDVVHRLDKDTSGAVVFSKHARANAFLCEQFQKRTTHKIYNAIVSSNFAEDEGIIDVPLGDHPNENIHKQAVRPDGRDAKTAYRVVEQMGDFALVEIEIFTGRTHQIRVHLEHIGCPLANDPLYGGRLLESPELKRTALHSKKLELILPCGKKRAISAKIPRDMQAFLESRRA